MTVSLDFNHAVRSLTIKEIRDTLPPDTFTSGEKRSRSKLEEAASMPPLVHRSVLVDAALFKCQRKEHRDHEVVIEPDHSVQPLSDTPFFEIVSEECLRECISNRGQRRRR